MIRWRVAQASGIGLTAVVLSIAVVLLAVALLEVTRATERDPSVVREFRRTHPCPATNQTTGPCPNFVVDHIIPLSLYGPDRPDNMQWQTVEDAKRKDKLEFEAYRKRVDAEGVRCPPS